MSERDKVAGAQMNSFQTPLVGVNYNGDLTFYLLIDYLFDYRLIMESVFFFLCTN